MSHALGDGQPHPDTNVSAGVDDPQIELIGVRKVFGDLVAVEGVTSPSETASCSRYSAHRVRVRRRCCE